MFFFLFFQNNIFTLLTGTEQVHIYGDGIVTSKAIHQTGNLPLPIKICAKLTDFDNKPIHKRICWFDFRGTKTLCISQVTGLKTRQVRDAEIPR